MANTDKITQVVEEIRDLMGTEYKVEHFETRKNNGVICNNVSIFAEGKAIAPSIIIDEYLDEYSVREIAENVIETYNNTLTCQDYKEFHDIENSINNFDNIREMLSIRLINKMENLDLFENVPYEDFLDLAIIATINISNNYTIKVTNNLLERWDISFDEILRIAKDNFYAKEKQFVSMAELMVDMFGVDACEMDSIDLSMYVLKNKIGSFAAGYITNDSVMDEIAKKLNSDLIVIPSSVHETIILPYDKETNIDDITQMVIAVNESEVEPEEVLSDHAYVYRIETGWEI